MSSGARRGWNVQARCTDVPSALVRPFAFLLVLLTAASPALAWSNGGYSADPSDPDYGTHDWNAEHALAWLPAADNAWITANRVPYLYGTELPDNAGPPDGIGDPSLHHVYHRTPGASMPIAVARNIL